MAQAVTFVFIERRGQFVPAGRLTMNDDDRRRQWGRFDYGRRYLERDDAIAIDPVRLPLGREPRFTEEGFLTFGAIDDAAPDGWGRYLMHKAMADRTPTDIEIILASGGERVGALAFGPTPDHPARLMPSGVDRPPEADFSLEDLVDAALEVQRVDLLTPELRRLLNAGSSLGGARPKGVTRWEGRDWIAKFPRIDDPAPECRIEHATMGLAATVELAVPRIALEQALGRDIYLIERFDREPDGATRIPFISGLTLLGAHPSELARHSYAELAEALRVHGSDVSRDLRELYARMVFNILVTNDDDHLRNHGFLHDGRGWRLSPLYDVVPKPQLGLERRLAIGVGEAGRLATLDNALSAAPRFNIAREDARALIDRMADRVHAEWEASFRASGIGAADRARFATCFRLADPQNRWTG